VFTGRYALSPYIKQIRFVFKGLIHWDTASCKRRRWFLLLFEGYNHVTPQRRVTVGKLSESELLNKLPAFYGTRWYIIILKEARHFPFYEPHESTSHNPLYVLRWCSNALSFMPRPSEWSVWFKVFLQNRSWIYLVSPACHIIPPPRISCLFIHHRNIIWWGIHIMKLLAMQFSPVSC
jgi:hypothetical protein